MKRLALLLAITTGCTIFVPVANAATKKTTLTFAVASTPSAGESIVTFYGQVKPAGKASVVISSFDGVTWKTHRLKQPQQVVAPGELPR